MGFQLNLMVVLMKGKNMTFRTKLYRLIGDKCCYAVGERLKKHLSVTLLMRKSHFQSLLRYEPEVKF